MKKILLLLTFVFSQPSFAQDIDFGWYVRTIGAVFSNIKFTSPKNSPFVTIEANGIFHKIGKNMEEEVFNYGVLDKVTIKILKSSCDLTSSENREVTCESPRARATIHWYKSAKLSSTYKGFVQSLSFKSGEKFAEFSFTLKDSAYFSPFKNDQRYFIPR